LGVSRAMERTLVRLLAQEVAGAPISSRPMATVALLGTIFYRRLMTGDPFLPNQAGELVDTVIGRPRTRRHP